MKADNRNVAPGSGARAVSALAIIQSILDRGEDAMAKQRYQDPKILPRADVSRPFY